MITMLIISVVLVVLYTGITIYHTRQIPTSVSSMVYAFPRYKWLWTVWLWSVAFLLAPSLIDAMNGFYQFLGFGTIAMLAFCGAMPLFDKTNNDLHDFFGIGAGILSQLCVALISPWWLTAWILWVAVFIIKTKNRSFGEWKWPVFLAEAICYISLTGSILFS